MNCVRMGNEYWFKIVLRTATLTPHLYETHSRSWAKLVLKKSEVGMGYAPLRREEVQFCNGDLEQDLHTCGFLEAGDLNLNPPKFVKRDNQSVGSHLCC